MSQQPDHFIPETVDEQIEYLTQDSSGQQETANQELVHHLRHFYQNQVKEKKAGALDHAWERITHTQAYLKQDENPQTEQQGKKERRIHTMKTLPDPITDTPYDDRNMMTPPTRIRRISRFVQSLVAVLLVGILLGGFLVLFSSRHAPTEGSRPAPQKHPIIVVSTFSGTIYAIQSDKNTLLWQRTLPRTANSITPNESEIAIQNKVVYTIEDNQIYALRVADGTLLWKKALEKPVISYNMLQVDSGVVYVSEEVAGVGSLGHMYALQASSGAILWHHTESESLLTAANGTVYTQVSDPSGINEVVKAFRGKDGQLLWQYPINAMKSIVSHDTLYIYAVHKLTSGDNRSIQKYKSLLALNTKTGKLLWSQPIIDYGENPLVIANNMIIVGSLPNQNSYRYCAYNTGDGAQMWCSGNATVPASSNTTQYIVMDNILYTLIQRATNTQNTNKQLPMMGTCQLEARNISNRNLLWSYSCAALREGFFIAGSNGNVFIAGDGNTIINVLNSHGHVQKTLQFGDADAIASLASGSW
jgi:outer membrane protein assembly factor BamB